MKKISASLDEIASRLQERGLHKHAYDLDIIANTADKSPKPKFMSALRSHNNFITLYRRKEGPIPYELQKSLREIMREYDLGKIDASRIKKSQDDIKAYLSKEVIEESVLKTLLKMDIISRIF